MANAGLRVSHARRAATLMVVVATAACASGPLRIEADGDGWTPARKLGRRWRSGELQVDAPVAFEAGDYPFAGKISAAEPIRVSFRPVDEFPPDVPMGFWVDRLHHATSRSPIQPGVEYTLADRLPESERVGGFFRLRRAVTRGEAWVVAGDETNVDLHFDDGAGPVTCEFHVEVGRAAASSEVHWYTPILGVVVLPLYVIVRLLG